MRWWDETPHTNSNSVPAVSGCYMPKLKTPKAWTQHARGQDCTVRLFQICNYNPETTVFAHLPNQSMGMKGVFGCFACSDCHDVLDGRVPNHYAKWDLEAHHRQGVVETMEILIRDGILKI